MPMNMGITASGFDFIEELITALARPSMASLYPIENAIRQGFGQNFGRQGVGGGGPWPSLARRTRQERAQQGYGASFPILIRSGRYFRSWTQMPGWNELVTSGNGWVFYVGSSHPNAVAHELGVRARKLPARPVRYLGNGDQQNVARAVDLWVDRVLRRFS